MAKIEQCRSCKAPVIWARLEPSMAATPIDAEPVANGNIAVRQRADGEVIARVIKRGEEYNFPRRTNHFATCPDAKTWRAKK